MLPWVVQDRRSRFLVATFLVSWLGLLCVVWWLGHYAAPLTGLTFALVIQCMRHLRQLRFETRPVGLAWLRVSVLMLFVAFGASLVRQIQHPYSWIFGFGPGNLQRASMLQSLQRQPGKHLIMVRYGHGHPHYVHDEWVYNSADIDSAKVVWARELNTDQDEKVISYFSDRHLWLVEPDNAPVALKPYTPPTLITSTNTQ
jgi:hypothetical protein